MAGISKAFGALTDSMVMALKRLNEGMEVGDDVVSTQNLINAPFGEPLVITGKSPDGKVAQVVSPKTQKQMNIFLSDLAPTTGDIEIDDVIQQLLKEDDREPGVLNEMLAEFNVNEFMSGKKGE